MSDPRTENELAAIRSRLNAVPTAPWYQGDAARRYENPTEVYESSDPDNHPGDIARTESPEIATFVAHAPQDVTDLLELTSFQDRRLDELSAVIAAQNRKLAGINEILRQAPSQDPLRGFGGRPDDMPMEGDFEAFGKWSQAEELRTVLREGTATSQPNINQKETPAP